MLTKISFAVMMASLSLIPNLAQAQNVTDSSSHSLTGSAVRALVNVVAAENESFASNDASVLHDMTISINETPESVGIEVRSVAGVGRVGDFVFSKATRTIRPATLREAA